MSFGLSVPFADPSPFRLRARLTDLGAIISGGAVVCIDGGV